MNIGFDAKRLFNNFTGLGNYSRTIIDILTEYFPENNYWLYTPKVRMNDITRPYILKNSCKTIHPSKNMPGSLWRTFLQSHDLHKNRIDVFHGLSHEIPVGLHKRGIPSIVTMHDVAFKTFKKMYHWHDRQIYDIKFHYACKNANHIIAISESTKNDVMRFYGVEEEKISVIYQPVQQLYYKPLSISQARKTIDDSGLKIPRDYMLYVGSVNSRKNLLSVVKAMEKLPKDSQIPLIVIGGGGDYKHTVQEYIANHNLGNLFIWPQVNDNHLLQAIYTCARLFVYPSFYEGFGLPVVEAMLSGCPVVTSNTSSLPEAGGPAALLANPQDIDDIARCILTGIEDDTKRKEMIVEGRKYANLMFSPETIANDMMNLYNKVRETS